MKINKVKMKWILGWLFVIYITISFRYATISEDVYNKEKVVILADRWRSGCIFCSNVNYRKHYYYKVKRGNKTILRVKIYYEYQEGVLGTSLGTKLESRIMSDTLFISPDLGGEDVASLGCDFKLPLDTRQLISIQDLPVEAIFRDNEKKSLSKEEIDSHIWIKRDNSCLSSRLLIKVKNHTNK